MAGSATIDPSEEQLCDSMSQSLADRIKNSQNHQSTNHQSLQQSVTKYMKRAIDGAIAKVDIKSRKILQDPKVSAKAKNRIARIVTAVKHSMRTTLDGIPAAMLKTMGKRKDSIMDACFRQLDIIGALEFKVISDLDGFSTSFHAQVKFTRI